MFKGLSVLFSFMMLFIVGCSTNSFLPVHDFTNGTTLGQRTVSDPHAFSPGTQRSWMEVCQRKDTKQKNGSFKWTETEYVQPCTFTAEQPGTNFVTYSPYVNGLATPLIQAGAILGASALLADGIRDSRSSTTNNTSSNGGNQAQGQGQLQGQGQGQLQGQSSSNFNANSNHATGGNGGNGFGGAGGNGGAGGHGGNGGNGGNSGGH